MVRYPIYEIFSVLSPLGMSWIINSPSILEGAPRLVPTTMMFAPMRGSPVNLSSTFPLIVPDPAAYKDGEVNKYAAAIRAQTSDVRKRNVPIDIFSPFNDFYCSSESFVIFYTFVIRF